jgi:ubiquinone/menaquinone biosynthesis C-methylase UbiE
MEYYNKIAKGYNKLHQKEQENKLRIIQTQIKLEPNAILLDIGCGTGISSEFFKCNIVGIDPARKMLNEAIKSEKSNTGYIQGSGEQLPFFDKSFDIVLCVTTLHNFKDYKAGLKEIKRVGKGKGAITILKKAKHADELKDSVKEIFAIQKEIEEAKDIILFFGLEGL